MRQENWLLCPVCGSKTRDRIRKDTVLKIADEFRKIAEYIEINTTDTTEVG